MASFCAYCGAAVQAGARFCTNCGHKVEEAQTDAVPSVPEQEPTPVPVTPPVVSPSPDQETRTDSALYADPFAAAEFSSEPVENPFVPADEPEPQPLPPATVPTQPTKQEKPKKKGGCLKWFLIVAIIGLVAVLAVVSGIWFIGIPRLQAFVMDSVENVLEDQLEDNIYPYNGRYLEEEIEEDVVNDFIQDQVGFDQFEIPAPFNRFVNDIDPGDLVVRFETRRLHISVVTNGLAGDLYAELDADKKGLIEISDVEATGLFSLVLGGENLDEQLTDLANEYYFEPRNLYIHEVEIDEGVIRFAYEPRE